MGQDMLWVDVVVRHPAPWAVAGLVVVVVRRRRGRRLCFIVRVAYDTFF